MAPRPRRADLELHDTPARALLRERPGDFPGVDERQLALCQHFLRVAKRSLATFGDAFAAHDLSPGRYAVLMARVMPVFQAIIRPSIVVAHGGIVRSLFRAWGGSSEEEAANMDVPQDKVLRIEGRRFAWL